MKKPAILLWLAFAVLLGGCAAIQPQADTNAAEPVPAPKATAAANPSAVASPAATAAAKPAAPGALIPPPPQVKTLAISGTEPETRKVEKPPGKADIFPGTGVFVKAQPQPAQGAKPPTGDEVMLNFEGADLREVVKAIVVDFLRETYIMDSRVQGVVNLHTTSPIPRTALLPTLETLLRMNGAAIIKEEGVFKVVPAATAVRGSITPQLGGSKAPMPGGYSVQIVPLKFLAAREMNKILEPFVTDATSIRIDEMRNLVILSGTERELRHLLETIDMFDIDWLAGMSVGLYTLQNVDVKTASGDLEKVFGAAAQSPLSGIVKLVPIERLNAILVVTQQPKYLEQAKIWIERMDRAGGAAGGTRLFVYPVQNGQAEKLASLINDVFGKTKSTKVTPAPTLAPGLIPTTTSSTPVQPAPATTQATGESVSVSGDIRVIADKDNNALLILASPSDYEKIESAIRKLDVVPRQVLVDVTIAEVQLVGELKFGLQWYLGSGVVGAASTAASVTTASVTTPGVFAYGNGGNLSGAKGLTGAGIWNAGRNGGVLSLLQTDSRVKIISSPHIMVTDNQTAKIQVGNQVPITTQTQSVVGATAAPVISNAISYLPTGVLLSVTPHINAGGMVRLEIDQAVTKPAPTDTSNISSPTIETRSISSTIVVKSGETMVLGGLITENQSRALGGLPLFSQIPILGGIFGNQNYQSDRTEMVMLITPRVVENSQQARDVTDEFRRKLGGLADYFEKSEKFDAKPRSDKQ